MALVPGASRFLSQATLASLQGSTFQQSTVLGQSTPGLSLLDVGRRLSNGVGLSTNARNLNRQFLEQNSATFNQLFSLSGGGSATVEASLVQIRGLQATVPVSRNVDLAIDDGEAAASSSDTGTTVDETV